MSTVAEQIELRDYQHRTVDAVHDAMRSGKRTIIIVSPTGSGKRILALWWARLAADNERDVLFVTDRKLLVEQPSRDLGAQNVKHGIIMGDYTPELHHRIQLATIQSLDSRYLSGDVEALPNANLLLVDEAHKSLDLYQQLFKRYPDARKALFTATPVGPKGTSLLNGNYADCIVEVVKNSELIQQGYLLPTRVFAPSEPNMKGIKPHAREEFPAGPLGRRIAEVTCFANMFDEYAAWADRQTIIFAPSIAYANGLVHPDSGDSFYCRGIPAAVISSKVKHKERDRILDAFRAGDLRVLVSVDILREGFDVPAVSCAIDLQPNAQLRTYWQKIGRIKRPHENQKFAVYIDMAGNSWRFSHPDDDPQWPTGEQTTQDLIDKIPRSKKPVRCPKCGEVYKAAPRCPACGNEPKPSEIVRVIRMGNGKLKEIPAEEIKKHQKSDAAKQMTNWKSALIAALKSGKTFGQAMWICKQRYDHWPPWDCPCLPQKGTAQRDMSVADVYSMADIMREFER